MLTFLGKPVEPEWLMARVASLLNPYFEKETPQAVRQMEMEDWAAELDQYPQWAIQKAVRWWKSRENHKRGKRPVEGDISARCIFEMQAIRAARIAMSSPIKVKEKDLTDEPRQELCDQKKKEANAMASEVGLNKTRGFKPHVGGDL